MFLYKAYIDDEIIKFICSVSLLFISFVVLKKQEYRKYHFIICLILCLVKNPFLHAHYLIYTAKKCVLYLTRYGNNFI